MHVYRPLGPFIFYEVGGLVGFEAGAAKKIWCVKGDPQKNGL